MRPNRLAAEENEASVPADRDARFGGNLLFLVTNHFDLTCDEISEMHRSRWAIELFFKWIKHLYGKRMAVG
ncbi:transposase [Paenibacillus sp. NPDC057967]|uniref:transposase n=1 Tax=Paenibacillus sp. NPDC057967 TaxID=3346293 RepID=UPI0036D82859